MYNLVFKGQLVKSADLNQTKTNISKLFKVSGEKLELMFSGKAVILKRNVDFDTAVKYRVAIKKAGAAIDLVEVAAPDEIKETAIKKVEVIGDEVVGDEVVGGEAPQQATSAIKSNSAASSEKNDALSLVEQETSSGLSIKHVDHTAGEANVESAVSQQVNAELAVNASLAPLGGNLADPVKAVSSIVDVSAFSLREQGGELLDDSEKATVEAVKVSVPDVGLSALGEDLLKSEEKAKAVTLDIDISLFSVADPGAKLADEKPASPPAPDVSKFTLLP